MHNNRTQLRRRTGTPRQTSFWTSEPEQSQHSLDIARERFDMENEAVNCKRRHFGKRQEAAQQTTKLQVTINEETRRKNLKSPRIRKVVGQWTKDSDGMELYYILLVWTFFTVLQSSHDARHEVGVKFSGSNGSPGKWSIRTYLDTRSFTVIDDVV